MTHNRKNGNVSWMNQQQINIQEKKMTSNNLSWHLFDGRKSMRMPIIIVRIIITTIIKTRKKNDKEMDFISGSAKFTRFIITRVVVEQAGWMACVGARARALIRNEMRTGRLPDLGAAVGREMNTYFEGNATMRNNISIHFSCYNACPLSACWPGIAHVCTRHSFRISKLSNTAQDNTTQHTHMMMMMIYVCSSSSYILFLPTESKNGYSVLWWPDETTRAREW